MVNIPALQGILQKAGIFTCQNRVSESRFGDRSYPKGCVKNLRRDLQCNVRPILHSQFSARKDEKPQGKTKNRKERRK